MATFSSMAEFAKQLDELGRDLTVREKHKITDGMGRRAQKLAERAASNDLGGDPKFSGWKPPLDTRTRRLSDGSTLLTPTARSAGPWTVAERGRNQGDVGLFAGPGVNRMTGETARTKSGAVRKTRAFKARRWNGTTQGKQTASDAVELMEREMPKLAEEGVRRAIRKRFD